MNTKTKTVVLFGDSLLANMSKGFTSIIERKIKNISVYNCAIGGINTMDGLKMAKMIVKLKPNLVILSFGANDAATWKQNVPQEKFKKNLDSIVKIFFRSKIILFPCPFSNDSNDIAGSKKYNSSLEKYNDIVSDVAKKNKALVFDTKTIYGNLVRKGINFHEDDGLHLNDFGYKILANNLIKLIK